MHLNLNFSGSSFYDHLHQNCAHLLPHFNLDESSRDILAQLPRGTTVLALRFDKGVLMAGDRMATEGLQVSSRHIEKVFRADRHSAIAIAWAAGPCIEIARLFQTELEHYDKIEGEPLTLEGKATKLAFMIKENLPAAIQGLVVLPIFAGFDVFHQRGRIYKYDITGGRYEELEFHAVGSGGKDARSALKKSYRAELRRGDALRLALEALYEAAEEDIGTGGPDLVRGIFPSVKTITADGLEDVPEEELRSFVESLVNGQRASYLARDPANHTTP